MTITIDNIIIITPIISNAKFKPNKTLYSFKVFDSSVKK